MAAGGLLCMKERLCILLTLICLLPAAVFFSRKDGRIPTMHADGRRPVMVIDPGHGGEDGGAVGPDGSRESEINLAVSLRTDALLGFFGWPCVMTRAEETLEYPPSADTVKKRKQADLDRRVKLADSTPNAVLISIHQNKYPSAGPQGAQVLFREDAESIRLADLIQERFKAALGESVRSSVPISDKIYLMRKVRCPAVLIECGFLSNPEESKLLRSEAYQTKLALCIACACAEYAREWENAYGQGGEG